MLVRHKNAFPALLILSFFSNISKADESLVSDALNKANSINNKTIYSANIRNTTQYDTNPLFLNNQEGVFRNTTSGKWLTTTTFDTTVVGLSANLDVVRSSNETIILNNEYPSLDANLTKSFESGSVGFLAQYAESSARTSSLQESGLVFTDNVRVNKTVGVKLSKEWDDLTSVDWSLNASKTNYKTAAPGLIPNVVYNALVSLRRSLKENLSAVGQVSYSNQKPENRGYINATIVSGGFSWILTDKAEVSAQIGKTHTNIDGASSTSGQYYLLSYKFEGESSSNIFKFNRTTTPSPLGIVLESDNYTFNHSKLMSQRANIYCSLSRIENKKGLVSTYNIASVGYNYSLTQDFTLNVFAGYQQFERMSSTNDSKDIGLTLTYNYNNR